MPTQSEIAIWRGNTETIEVLVVSRSGVTTTPVNLTGSTLNFRAEWTGGSFTKPLVITDAPAGKADLRLTPSETRSLPRSVPGGALVTYEIERRVGAEEKTILYGRVAVGGGRNDDA